MKGTIKVIDANGNVLSETPFDDGQDCCPRCPCGDCPRRQGCYPYPMPSYPVWREWWTSGVTFTVNANMPSATDAESICDEMVKRLRVTGVNP